MAVIKGPADADNWRVQRGYQRWYYDPLPGDDIAPATDEDEAYPSVSAVKKASGGDWSFVTRRRLAQAVAADPDVFRGLSDVTEIADRMRAIDQADLRRASERGTNVHLYFERGLFGESIDPFIPDEPGSEYLGAVRHFFDTYQPELVAAEMVCIHRSLHGVGYGGTGDAIVKFHGGPPEVRGRTAWVDWKSRAESSKHAAYPEEAQQLAAYNSSEYCIIADEDGSPKRAPLPTVDMGAIVSVKPDGFRVYPIDLEKAQVQWTNLHAYWVGKQADREPIGRQLAPVPMKDPIPDLIAAANSYDELLELHSANRGRWNARHTELARQRRAQLENS